MQLQTKKAVGAVSLAPGSTAAVAEAIKTHISDQEKALQEGLEEMYTNMTEETFKVTASKKIFFN